MVIAVRTEEDDGGLVVVKEARSDGDVARLTREATILARARHPGVVDLVSVEERAIRLRHAGTALARLGPFPADQVAGIACAVADVVHALHRLGVVHGGLEPGHVLLDERGRPRLCGFGLAGEYTAAGAADDVAALGRLLAGLLRAGEDLPWAHPPVGLRRRSQQRQARRELEAIAAQATREQREQRPTARQLAKAVHAAVPGCSLPVPGSTERGPAPAFAEIPADIDPTADLGWTADDLSWLASQDDDGDQDEAPETADPYAGLGALGALSFDGAPEDWAELAAHPEAVTGPLPVLPPEPSPPERARIELDVPTSSPDASASTSVPLPTQASSARQAPKRRRGARAAALVVVLVVGVVGGAVGARTLRPLGSDPVSASDAARSTTTTEAAPDRPAGTGVDGEAPASTWPAGCEVPEPAGPDVDGDGCPEAVELDGREARVGSVGVVLGDEGDLVALGDWDCDGTATPALLRPATGEVFVFPEWRLDAPLEVEAAAVVDGASAIAAGPGSCPTLSVTTPAGNRTVELPA